MKIDKSGTGVPLTEGLRGAAPEKSKNPSKKRRDAWKWTTCKGCKFKKECDAALPYLPPCGRDYDEELALEHDAAIRADERERVLEDLKTDLNTRFISSSNQWSVGRNSGLLECCNIINERLRQPEREQP